MGLPHASGFSFFYRGYDAVGFFFVLSGFLITFLLLRELDIKEKIEIKTFYLKRIFRIWPLYFGVVIFGLVFYNYILPSIGLSYKGDYELLDVIPLYVFFLPNLAYSIYHVGGILSVTWSIGIEEQFYLFWAPLFNIFKSKIFYLICGFYIFWAFFQICTSTGLFTTDKQLVRFLETMQFHSMAVGGIGAYYCFYHKKVVLSLTLFQSKIIRIFILSLILIYFLITDFGFSHGLVVQILPWFFLWLIIEVSINPATILSLEKPILNKLGEVSYGVYMFHFIVIYLMSYLFNLVDIQHHVNYIVFLSTYFIAIFIVTLFFAFVSFNYVERPFMNLGKKLYSSTKNNSSSGLSIPLFFPKK